MEGLGGVRSNAPNGCLSHPAWFEPAEWLSDTRAAMIQQFLNYALPP
jgi:hypothetical protein